MKNVLEKKYECGHVVSKEVGEHIVAAAIEHHDGQEQVVGDRKIVTVTYDTDCVTCATIT